MAFDWSPLAEYIDVEPSELLTDDDRERIRACKPDLLSLLAGGPPDDPVSSSLRAQLLVWGAPGDWPAVASLGLGAGATPWTEWLLTAQRNALERVVAEAERVGVLVSSDPRQRLASWGIDHRYPRVPGIVRAGVKAWEVLVNEGPAEAVEQALGTRGVSSGRGSVYSWTASEIAAGLLSSQRSIVPRSLPTSRAMSDFFQASA